MRITVIGPAHPHRGGIAHHVYSLKQNLTDRGHTVQLISFRKLYPQFLFPGTSELDVSSTKFDAGARALLSPLDPISWNRALREIEEFSPDLAIFQWWQPFFAPPVGVLARRLRRLGIRCLVECHNVFPHERVPLARSLIKFALRPIDAFVTHSEKDREDLSALVSGKRIGVSPLPVPREFSDSSRPDRSGMTILFFGKVRKYKGLEVLIKAMPKVLAEVDCRLKIVGEFYEPVKKYKELIREFGAEKSVSIVDRYVPNEEVAPIFAQADVLVLPYLSASQSAVAQIALTNALPVIASRCGGLAEVVTDGVNGLLFPAGDDVALAEMLVRFFKEKLGPKFSKTLSESPNAAAEQLGALIEELAAGLKR